MKILHQFLKNLLIKNIAGVVLTTLALFSFSSQAKGLFKTFDSIIEIQKTNYEKKLETLVNKDFNVSDVSDLEKVKLDPDFINSIVFNSPGRYVTLGVKDKCSLYDLLTTNLIQGNDGKLNTVIIQYEDKKKKIQTRAIPLLSFLQKIAYIQCPKVRNLKAYFLPKNIRNTLKAYSLKTPSSYNECENIHQNFVSDIKTPHLCSMVEDIRNLNTKRRDLRNMSRANFRKYQNLKAQISRTQSLKKILSTEAQNYLTDLCLNINKPKKFCDNFFEQNTWTKVSQSSKKKSILRHYCKDLFPNKVLTKQRVKQCVKELSKKSELCHNLGKTKRSLFPKPNCELISKALAFSSLYSDYDDCPGSSGNEAATTLSRLFIHLNRDIPKAPSHCGLYSTQPYANFSLENNEAATWQVNVCYDDKIKKEKVCLPTTLGNVEESKLNLSTNIEKMVLRLKGYKNKAGCEVIKKNEYKPAFLKYQNGCFIILNEKECYSTSCKFKVILDQQEFTNYTFESDLSFDLFPRRFIDENKSIMKLLETIKSKRFKIIKSVSSIVRVFKKDPKTLILGVSCAEELLPTFYKKRTLNQCTPLPYIIDGYLEKKGIYSLVIRTSLDHVHAPRIIPWSYVYDSLVKYQRFHPIGIWGLNAIN